MDRVNPVYIPRNHLVEEALDAATAGDLDPFHRLVDVLADPYTRAPAWNATPVPPLMTSGATGPSAGPERTPGMDDGGARPGAARRRRARPDHATRTKDAPASQLMEWTSVL